MKEKTSPHLLIRADRGHLPSYPLPPEPSASWGLEFGQMSTSSSRLLIRTQQLFYLLPPTGALLFVPAPGRRWKHLCLVPQSTAFENVTSISTWFASGGGPGRAAPPHFSCPETRLLPTCSAASPATACAGVARRRPLQPARASSSSPSCPAVTLALALPASPPRRSVATCPAATAPTAASTAAHTSPNMTSLFPSPSKGAMAEPTCLTPCESISLLVRVCMIFLCGERGVNVGCGPAEQRLLLTGLHSVADIFCESCKTTLGWKYEQAFETSQKYKEGKYIIEMSHMVKDNGWD
uniref:Yippee like 4 n=1 Tax=Molossus molossus TaxID=27622 RepID=A0A7J8EVL1_MOLMO|nr:yippee like 4 [Molossus molossus]